MRAKDSQVLDVLRMVKTQAQAKKTSKGFDGETDDEFWTEIIARYVKQQKRALQEFERAGERGVQMAEGVRFEIEYLSPFLPRLKDEAEVLEMRAGEDSEDVIRQGSRILAAESGISRDLILGALLERNRIGETPAEILVGEHAATAGGLRVLRHPEVLGQLDLGLAAAPGDVAQPGAIHPALLLRNGGRHGARRERPQQHALQAHVLVDEPQRPAVL